MTLAEPAAGLRGVDAVGIGGRSLEVVDLPAGKVRAGDGQFLRLPSEVRMKAPLRVPTRTRTLLMERSPEWMKWTARARQRVCAAHRRRTGRGCFGRSNCARV